MPPSNSPSPIMPIGLGRRINLRVRLLSFDGVCRMLEKGVGVAIIPDSAAQRCKAAMEIRKVDLTDSWAVRELKICVRSLQALPLAGQHLVEHHMTISSP